MKVDIYIPEALNEITLEQYQKFLKINTKENENSSFLLQKMVEIFCRLNLQDIAKVKYSYVQEIAIHLNKIFDVKPDLIPVFEINNIEYGFIPNLDDITIGEYIDLDNTFGDWDKIHKAMAVLYRPIKFKKGNKYNIKDYEGAEGSTIMKQAPLDVVMGSMVFFYHLNSELLTTTLNYLSKEMKTNLTTEQKKTLEQNGVGINQFMDLVKEMLPSSIL